jgi:hypothetical protein
MRLLVRIALKKLTALSRVRRFSTAAEFLFQFTKKVYQGCTDSVFGQMNLLHPKYASYRLSERRLFFS